MEESVQSNRNLFPTTWGEIERLIDTINPLDYQKTRNYKDGAVSKLSPYISRGVISTKYVLDKLIQKGYSLREMDAFVKELAWRDYFQRIGQHRTHELISPILIQENVSQKEVSSSILDAKTGIIAVDEAIQALYKTGYIHNHARMYLASISCNLLNSHWFQAARWMYYHLLDADFASNACSWQWICAVRSKKRYYANQENINHFFNSSQKETFLDVDYSEFPLQYVPSHLKHFCEPSLPIVLPESSEMILDTTKPTLIYTPYNLDVNWHKGKDVNRIFLFEPSFLESFPMSSKTIQFMLDLNANCIQSQVYVGEFSSLKKHAHKSQIIFKEHPLFKHFVGISEERDWISTQLVGEYSSFFQFWKKLEKELKSRYS
jgi:deoxyribodipyrimidine photo-lyase